MRYDLPELDETRGLHALLKNTKFAFFRRFWSERLVDIALGRVTYFEALFLAPPRCQLVEQICASIVHFLLKA